MKTVRRYNLLLPTEQRLLSSSVIRQEFDYTATVFFELVI